MFTETKLNLIIKKYFLSQSQYTRYNDPSLLGLEVCTYVQKHEHHCIVRKNVLAYF
jgi:hypothetical protein